MPPNDSRDRDQLGDMASTPQGGSGKGWAYGTTDGAALSPGQVVRGAESRRTYTLERRARDGWVTTSGDWIRDWQMQYFEPFPLAEDPGVGRRPYPKPSHSSVGRSPDG